MQEAKEKVEGMSATAASRRRGLRKGYSNRRDLCWFVGKRALTLTPLQMTYAWDMMARQLHHRLGEMDLPKFVNLISLIRAATIKAKSVGEPE